MYVRHTDRTRQSEARAALKQTSVFLCIAELQCWKVVQMSFCDANQDLPSRPYPSLSLLVLPLALVCEWGVCSQHIGNVLEVCPSWIILPILAVMYLKLSQEL